MQHRHSSTATSTLTKYSFFIGPVLLFLSAAAFAAGIGLLPGGKTSYVEGILGSFALIFFVPVYLELADQLSATHRRLGLAASITGICGAVVGASHELFRVIEWTLRSRGAGDAVWASFYSDPGAEYLVVALLGPLFPATSIILGAGFLRAGTLPGWIAVCLITAGVGFPLAQVLEWDWGLRVTYPLATLLWMAALTRVGMKYLRKPG